MNDKRQVHQRRASLEMTGKPGLADIALTILDLAIISPRRRIAIEGDDPRHSRIPHERGDERLTQMARTTGHGDGRVHTPMLARIRHQVPVVSNDSSPGLPHAVASN